MWNGVEGRYGGHVWSVGFMIRMTVVRVVICTYLVHYGFNCIQLIELDGVHRNIKLWIMIIATVIVITIVIAIVVLVLP